MNCTNCGLFIIIIRLLMMMMCY